jgi:hypothetical protein
VEEKEVQKESQAERLVTKITVSYRVDGQEHSFTLEHTAGGAAIDAVSWSRDLMAKLAYLEEGKCVEARTEPDPGEWKLSTTESVAVDCKWVHDVDCMWYEVC